MLTDNLLVNETAVRVYPYGESAIVLEYQPDAERDESEILSLQQRLLQAGELFKRETKTFVIDIVPGNLNLTVTLQHSVTDLASVAAELYQCWKTAYAATGEQASNNTLVIPVLYGGEAGPDLGEVARYHRISEARVIELHTQPVYTVLFNGFLPGFGYLHGLDPALHTPRRATPRTRVERGAVAIGGAQTGIYPLASPGGWQIIGRCADDGLPLFDPARKPPQLLAAGVRIRFEALTGSR